MWPVSTATANEWQVSLAGVHVELEEMRGRGERGIQEVSMRNKLPWGFAEYVLSLSTVTMLAISNVFST